MRSLCVSFLLVLGCLSSFPAAEAEPLCDEHNLPCNADRCDGESGYWVTDSEGTAYTPCIGPGLAGDIGTCSGPGLRIEDDCYGVGELADPCPPGEVGQDLLGTGQPCIDPTLCEEEPGEIACGVDDPTNPDPTPDVGGGLCTRDGRPGAYVEYESLYVCVRRGQGPLDVVCVSTQPEGPETCF